MARTNEKLIIRDHIVKLGEIFCFAFTKDPKGTQSNLFHPMHAHLPNKYVFLGPNLPIKTAFISLIYEN